MTLVGALAAGLTTSLHCVGMCGPLVCSTGMLAKHEGERMVSTTLYHGGRLFSYAVVGALCGFLGQQPLKWFFASRVSFLPWALVVALVVIALGWEKKLMRLRWMDRAVAPLRAKIRGLSYWKAAGALGLLTPFLPCAPLYLMFGVALASGSALQGAEFALAFGFGTIPLLWLMQVNWMWLRKKMRPLVLQRVQRGLALVAAVLLALRLQGLNPEKYAAQMAGEKSGAGKSELPSCCAGEKKAEIVKKDAGGLPSCCAGEEKEEAREKSEPVCECEKTREKEGEAQKAVGGRELPSCCDSEGK